MTTVAQIMTAEVQTIAAQASLQRAAQWMDRLNIGSLPVCDGKRLLGMVTDRDITVRGTAAGLAPGAACVADVMSGDPQWCLAEHDVAEVLQRMADEQIRRLPVLDAEQQLVGIVALGDLATKQPQSVQATLREISTPCVPDGGPAQS
jgi:CBS domain-containing protein